MAWMDNFISASDYKSATVMSRIPIFLLHAFDKCYRFFFRFYRLYGCNKSGFFFYDFSLATFDYNFIRLTIFVFFILRIHNIPFSFHLLLFSLNKCSTNSYILKRFCVQFLIIKKNLYLNVFFCYNLKGNA